MPPRFRWAWAVLLAEVLLFFRPVLFVRSSTIPWDFRAYHFPLAWTMARAFANFEFPLWSPATYCGMPFYAILQSQAFYPPTILAVLLSNLEGGRHLLGFMELQLAAHVLLAGLFTYRLLRTLELGTAAALCGATIFQLGAFFASQTQHLGVVNAAAWMPLAWHAVVLLGRGFSWRRLAVLVAALALSILAGFPAVAAVAFGSTLLLGLAWNPRRAPWVVLACGWAVLVCAVQLLPTMELTRLSVAGLRKEYLDDGSGVPLAALVTLVWPNRWRVFQFGTEPWTLPWNPTFLYLYCGIPALVFAATALVRRAGRLTAVFAVLLVVTGLWMLGVSTPVGPAVFRRLPGDVRAGLYPDFAMCGFVLSLAVLAGIGADVLLARRSLRIQAAVVLLVAVDLIAAGSGRPMNTVSKRNEPGVTYEQMDGLREPADLLRRLTSGTAPPSRFEGLQNTVSWVGAAPLLGLETSNGDDPFALVRMMRLRSLIAEGPPWTRYWEAVRLDSPILKMMNVEYLAARTRLEAPGGLERVAEVPGMTVYRNPGALPRFYLVGRARRAAGLKEAIAMMGEPGFNPRTEAVVEAGVEAQAAGRVAVLAYGAREITLETDAAGPALLVSSEAWYPGWRAWIDGKEAPLVIVNAAFRGLAVPAGRRRVRMRFDPPVLWRGGGISLAALAILAALAVRDNKLAKGAWIS